MQIFDSGELGFISPEIPKDIKIITMKGENIEVKLLKEGLGDDKVSINANGENLFVKNGETEWIIKGNKIYTKRVLDQSDVSAEIVNPQKQGQMVETTVTEQGSETIVDGNLVEIIDKIPRDSEKRVCIGRMCAIGGLKALSGLEDPFVREYDYELGYFEDTIRDIVSKTEIYASESEVNKFLNSLPKGLNEQQLNSMAADFLKNNKIKVALQIDLSQKQIDANINKNLEPLGLPKEGMKVIGQFKAKIFRDFPEGVPKGTSVIIFTNYNDGKQYGIFGLTFPNKKVYALKISGNYISKLFKEKITDKEARIYTTKELWEMYGGR